MHKKLSHEDKEKAETIDWLVSIGDWNTVGATAAAFDSDSSMSGTKRSNMVGLDQANGSKSFGSGGNQESKRNPFWTLLLDHGNQKQYRRSWHKMLIAAAMKKVCMPCMCRKSLIFMHLTTCA